MRYLVPVLLSVALILTLQSTPVNKVAKVEAKAKAVQVVVPDKTTEATQTLMEQKTVVAPASTSSAETAQAVDKSVPQGCATYVPLLQQYDWNYQVMAAG